MQHVSLTHLLPEQLQILDKELDSLVNSQHLYKLWLSALILEMNQRITDITASAPQDVYAVGRREQLIGDYHSLGQQLGNAVDGTQSWFADLSKQVKQQLKQH